jgi:PLP dependent protein
MERGAGAAGPPFSRALLFDMTNGTITRSMYEARVGANLPRVEERIARARERSGRAAEVTIVAVTKGHPAEAVTAAAAAGLGICGENRVAELEAKRGELGGVVEWHLIGHLQRNKVRRSLPLFELLQSVDSHRLAEAVSAEAVRAGTTVRILVQINASGEASKGGFDVRDGAGPVAQVAALPGLVVQGLMTMAPYEAAEAELRATFGALRELFERCAAQVPAFEARHLSMGMSNDFEIAVEEGSTMVRLGTVLFGERER